MNSKKHWFQHFRSVTCVKINQSVSATNMPANNLFLFHLPTYIFISIGTLINVFLLILLIIKRPHKTSTWFLCGWLFFLGISNQIVSIIIISQTDAERALNLYHLGSLSLVFVPLFYFFTISFFNLKKNVLLTILAFAYTIGIPLLEYLNPGFLIKDVIWDPNVKFFIPVFDPTFEALSYTAFILWFYSLFKILQLYKNSRSSHYRNKLKYILLGSIIPIIGFMAISVPIREIRRYPLDNFGITVGSILMVYGVIKYKALNITLIVRKGLIYSILTFLITSAYLVISFVFQRIFFSQNIPTTTMFVIVPSSIIIALFFQPLNSISIRLIDRLFYRKSYIPQELLSKISYEINTALVLEDLGVTIIKLLKSAFFSKKIVILLKTKSENYKLISKNGVYNDKKYHKAISLIPVKLLHEQDTLGIYDIEDTNLAKQIEKLNIEIVTTLFIKNRLIGFICFGPKKSDELYSLEDIDVINTVGNQAAAALENALLYDELKVEKRRIEKLFKHEIEVNEMKSEFIMMSSHSLRTPITIIRGYINSLYEKREAFPAQDKQSIESIFDSTNNLSLLVEDLLILSNIHNKKIQTVKEKLDLVPILNRTVQTFLPSAAAKGLVFEYVRNGITEAFIKGDKYQITIAVNNLVDNAIKFTEKGKVQLILVKTEDKYQIQVKDTGIGIPESEIGKLFNQFHQVRSSKYEAVPGNGLGLYIVKSIVTAHDGECSVSSAPDKGSTFSITIPEFI
ncbi:MAG: Signal transduction histidine kinase [Candidatus Woesebacteria bacterium GW2011_GWA1_39_21]|uniref:histidine kinase n=1 Tax=Candidatus Woesebacteria bacterium GW2011_GWA1_39_21 TaxID=1618550 RepID=A0A0G0N4M6_9BACT|nr:MAG: Signal transduction histidine kinase [Candidatus Woesebacteria bacterium GW2011_GWA1_39_21]